MKSTKGINYVIFFFLALTLLLSEVSLIGHAMTGQKNYITNTNYMAVVASRYKIDKSKKNEGKTSKKKKAKDKSKKEKEEINPTQVYHLVAVYILGKKARALIKNDLEPEEGTLEYRVGDYLDEEKTISISRISLYPTARIELIDKHGLTYLMKPSVVDTRYSKGKSKGTASSSSTFPTYSSSSKPKKSKTKVQSKAKKASAAAATSSPTPATTPAPAQASQPAPAASTGTSSTTESAAIMATATTPPVEKPKKDTTQALPASQAADAELGVSRPANPFGD